MSCERLTFLILTTAFLAFYSLSSFAEGSNGVAVESANGTRKMDAKSAPTVKVTDAKAEVVAGRSKVTELPGERRTEGSAVTVSTLSTEKPSTVRSGERGAKKTAKVKTIRKAHSGEDEDEDEEEEENDDYYDDTSANTTNIVDAPCAKGLQRDSKGTCRQHLKCSVKV